MFVSALVTSNVLSAKLIVLGPLTVPGGVVCYAVTYLMSDVAGELYGRERSGRMLKYGFICQVLCSALTALTILLQSADGEQFDMLMRSNMWFTAASLAAYLVSQSVDVGLFHFIRRRMLIHGKRRKWVWNNVSTIVSQATDTAVYVLTAFGIGMGYLWDAGQYALLWQMMLGQMLVKAALAIADTPLFYLLTKRKETE